MNLEFGKIAPLIQFFLAENQWRHSLLFRFGKRVFREFETASSQEQ